MAMSDHPLKAPFPFFGGKTKVSDIVWERLGNPDNYVEPFAGSLANLLRRPHSGKIETVNDRNHFIPNVWRAIQADPEAVAEYADHPVTEIDLHARHHWLMLSEAAAEFREKMKTDPEFFDAKVAGWWVWGQCCWIGSGWCDSMTVDGRPWEPKPDVYSQLGVHGQIPDLSGDAGAFGRGVVSLGRPQLGDAYDIGRGVNSNGSAGTCEDRRTWLMDWMKRLSDRLRLVRVCYGDWNRICNSNTTMTRLGITGAFLDPPYAKNIERVQALIRGESVDEAESTNRANVLYAGDKDQDIDQLVADVNLWCQKWGAEENVRIALCGYDGEHNNLVNDHGWTVVEWKAHGGYGNRNKDNENKHRERLWFSPGCQSSAQGTLF